MRIEAMAGFLRKLLKVTAKLFLGLSVIFALVIAIGMYSNHRALKAAEHFCDQIALGSDITQIVQTADASGIRYIEPLRQFYFQGWVFNAAICEVKVENNKISSKRVEMRGD
jgi:hypothetical protein